MSDQHKFSVGDTVVLDTPENGRLDRSLAKIAELTEWGAHVTAPAAATNQFRALFSEMEPLAFANQIAEAAVSSGYSGDLCARCGSLRMKRAGSCLTCDDCGETNGCG